MAVQSSDFVVAVGFKGLLLVGLFGVHVAHDVHVLLSGVEVGVEDLDIEDSKEFVQMSLKKSFLMCT